MRCLQCSCKIEENGQHYAAGDMGSEIITILKESLGPVFDKNGQICSQCFSSITAMLRTESRDSDIDTLSVISSVSIKTESVDSEDDDGVPLAVTVTSSPVTSDASKPRAKSCQSVSEGEEIPAIAKTIAPRHTAKTKGEPKPGASDPLDSPKRVRKPTPPTFLSSPMRKRPKNVPLSSNEKTIALNVYKLINKLMATYPYKTDLIEGVAEVMGTSKSTIARILAEYKTTGRVGSPIHRKPPGKLVDKLDGATLEKVKHIVQQFDVNNEILTVDKVLAVVKEDEALPKLSRSTLHKLLKKLNVKFKKNIRKKSIEPSIA